jgi:hypothetical protein
MTSFFHIPSSGISASELKIVPCFWLVGRLRCAACRESCVMPGTQLFDNRSVRDFEECGPVMRPRGSDLVV